MLLFWFLAALMFLAALLLVVPPLMRDRLPGRDAPDDANVTLYRERLADLARERERGELGDERYAALRQDLERGLLADAGGRKAAPAVAQPPPRWMPAAVAVMVPVFGLGLYLWLGSPHGLTPRPPSGTPATGAASGSAPPVEAVEAMVASLAATLDDEPANAEGWLLLARSQVVLERFDEALAAFERAHALLGDEPSLLTDWAEAEAGAAGNRFPARALDHLDRALEIDPDHEKALWLGGFAAVQSRRTDIAVARWERLLERQPPGSQEASIVTELLAQVRGTEAAVPAAGSGAAEPSAATAPGDGEAPAGGARITVEVSLAPDLGIELGAGEPVFVFARAPAGTGPPLAVARTVVGALPATIVLDESSAMVASMSLAGAEQVRVGARVARSGTASRTSGDVEGVSDPVPVAATTPVKIVLSRIVP